MSTRAASPDPRAGLGVHRKDAFIPDPGGVFSFHYRFCSLSVEWESLNSWMEATFTHLGYPQQQWGVFFLRADVTPTNPGGRSLRRGRSAGWRRWALDRSAGPVAKRGKERGEETLGNKREREDTVVDNQAALNEEGGAVIKMCDISLEPTGRPRQEGESL